MVERNGQDSEFVSAQSILDAYSSHEDREIDPIAAAMHGLSALTMDRLRRERPDILSGEVVDKPPTPRRRLK